MTKEEMHQRFIDDNPELFIEKESSTGRKYKGKNKMSFCKTCEMRMDSAHHLENPCPLPE